MITARATFWLKAFALPNRPADMITSSAAATSRSPVTANSRAMMTIAAHAATSPVSTRHTSTAEMRSLSARGSRNAPITVTMPRDRASHPSIESVRQASTNSANAHHRPPPGTSSTSSRTINGGIAAIRANVNHSGAFMSPGGTRASIPAGPPGTPGSGGGPPGRRGRSNERRGTAL